MSSNRRMAKARKILVGTVVAIVLSACPPDGTGPPIDLTGTFIGTYTATPNPGVVYQSVLQVTQTGVDLSGTFTSTAGRSANVSGSVSRTQLTATFVFTDGCAGTASTTADITNNGTRLTGNYTASDCIGNYSGGFVLDKQ